MLTTDNPVTIDLPVELLLVYCKRDGSRDVVLIPDRHAHIDVFKNNPDQEACKMRRLLTLLVYVTAVIMLGPNRIALGQQGASAGVYGSVLDSQGAAMPGAKVTLLHVTTNQVRTTTSDAGGEFRFPLLPVGEYRITVEHPGFKKHEQTGLQLQVNDNAKVDATFFAGTTVKSNFLCNLGYGDASKLYPRSPRLDFEEACKLV